VPFEYLEEIAIADVAFRASGKTIEEMFLSAAEALMNVMVEDLDSIEDRVRKEIRLEDSSIEMLLFNFLQEFIYLKDAEELLLRVSDVRITEEKDSITLSVEAYGERLDMSKHDLNADVKAVTFHRFYAKKTADGSEAVVVLDI
jgi:SHS2 domain-containing protein